MRLSLAKSLVVNLEQGNAEAVEQVINSLANQQESMLFQEVGKLTRQLHDSLAIFGIDDRFPDLAENRIPNARERLNYVIEKTEESAHRTLNAVEEALPIAHELEENGRTMRQDWSKFTRREMNAEEFRQMSKHIEAFLETVETDAKELNKGLSDVMMAQDFQDITGQIIRQVIELVQEMEESLVTVIRNTSSVTKHKEEKNIVAEGPQVNQEDNPDVMSGQDDVDDLLSSLGF
ncbi:MAG: protein phosphatase CheZ [Proteobacteria bacterium]|nr:protein phosphatase CheZ [Pseudomonadota bacterium]NOG58956.1 protein phosphatase CheZ [Pseudomonadota bacterium]